MKIFRRSAETLARDDRGTSVIEFALFAPILAVTLMGVTDVSMAYSRKLALEQSAFRALEKVSVGTVQTNYDWLKAEVAAADGAGGVEQSHVTVDPWLECDRVRQPAFDGSCPTGQMISRYVGLTVNYSYTPMFFEGPLAATAGGDGNVPISAIASVRIQ